MMLTPIFSTTSGPNGSFYLSLPAAKEYLLVAEKDNYFRSKKRLSPADLTQPITLELEPKPGYFMDVTIFDGQRVNANVNMVEDARVEIYNNTTGEQEVTIEKNPKACFNHSFKEGNHYTMLVRKQGYLNRRVEVYVDINDCILCIDGMGLDRPDVTDIMLRENQIGYLLGNIAMDTIEIGKTFNIENIYYDFDQSYIRPDAAIELDKLVTFLRDNPAIEVELSAHTDSRGSDSYNMSLSGRRAAAAVDYIINQGKVNDTKINSKGYGETRIVNGCSNGVPCSEVQHQQNRRTEIKITGYDNSDPLDGATLKEIIEIPDIYERMIEQRRQEQKLTKKVKAGV
jgi:outer membrane protein OmpA-like peptidoglycan-associated protein